MVKGVFGLRECCAHIVCEVETIMGDWNFHPKVRDCLVNQEKEEKEEEKEEKKEDKEEKKEEDKEEKKDEDKEEKKEDISMDSLVDKNSFEVNIFLSFFFLPLIFSSLSFLLIFPFFFFLFLF